MGQYSVFASNVWQYCASKKINTIVWVTGSVNLPVMLQCAALSGDIFLCAPADGGGSRVYACTSCKRLCRDGNTAENKPRYRQCDPAELDLFDGVNDEDEFTSIGIGDKQPSVYANLSCNDRMALGVLKVSPFTTIH